MLELAPRMLVGAAMCWEQQKYAGKMQKYARASTQMLEPARNAPNSTNLVEFAQPKGFSSTTKLRAAFMECGGTASAFQFARLVTQCKHLAVVLVPTLWGVKIGRAKVYDISLRGTRMRKRRRCLRTPHDVEALTCVMLFSLSKQYSCELQAWALFSNHYHLVLLSDVGKAVHEMVVRFHSDAAIALNRTMV